MYIIFVNENMYDVLNKNRNYFICIFYFQLIKDRYKYMGSFKSNKQIG